MKELLIILSGKTVNFQTLYVYGLTHCLIFMTPPPSLEQEGHDGPEIAHLNIESLHDREQVIL
jgi:hypothetical protein